MNFRGSLRRPIYGFTLVELLVSLVILGIIAAIAAPGIVQALANRRMQLATSELRTSIAQARLLAITSGRSVGLIPAYSAGWNIPRTSRGTAVTLPNSLDVSATSLAKAQLSWYVVTGGSVASTDTTTSAGATTATMANSTSNGFPVQVSLADQTMISVGTIPTAAIPAANVGICFTPTGYIGSVVQAGSGSTATTSCNLVPAQNFTQVSFRVCDSALSGEAGYTVLVGQFGTVQMVSGATLAANDPNDPVGNAPCL